MGHGGKRPYEIPDWKKYKVEDAPELVRVRDMLAQRGLKDPWLRNEVWRFTKRQPPLMQRYAMYFGRGIGYGFIAAALTIAFTELTGLAQHHGGGHGNHDNNHHQEEMDE